MNCMHAVHYSSGPCMGVGVSVFCMHVVCLFLVMDAVSNGEGDQSSCCYVMYVVCLLIVPHAVHRPGI